MLHYYDFTKNLIRKLYHKKQLVLHVCLFNIDSHNTVSLKKCLLFTSVESIVLMMSVLLHVAEEKKNNQNNNVEIINCLCMLCFEFIEFAGNSMFNDCTMPFVPNVYQSICIFRRQQEMEVQSVFPNKRM